MSRKASDWAWDQALKPHLKLVLLTIADRSDANGECFPKVSTIAKDTCQSERSVLRQLTELVDLGFIHDTGKRIGRTNKTKVWKLVGFHGDTVSCLNDDNLSQLGGESRHSVMFKGDTQSCSNGDTQSCSYIEPSIKESPTGTKSVVAAAKAPAVENKIPADSTLVFEAYSKAMKNRYGQAVSPARNAKINKMLNNIIERIGLDGAILVASNFPFHSNSWYVQKVHSVDCMLGDCESLLIQCQSGQMITKTGAYQADKSGHFQNQIQQANNQYDSREAF